MIYVIILLNQKIRNKKMKIKDTIKNPTSIRIYKYVNISTYCHQYIKNSTNNYIRQVNIIEKEKIKELDEDYNLFAIQFTPNNNIYVRYDEQKKEFNFFKLNILFYYDWFPHIMRFLLLNSDPDFCQVIYFILKENEKINARKWNIFINQEKIEMTFNEVLLYLIQNHIHFQKYFLSKKEFELNNCNDCQNRKIIQISKKYSLCKNYDIDFYGDEYSDTLCYNFKF
jgi:hypothetical protein